MPCNCTTKRWVVTAADGRVFTDVRTQAEASAMARRLNGTYGVQNATSAK